MATLLAFNDSAALVGDFDGHVRTEIRPDNVSEEQWPKHVRSQYSEPKHWYPDAEGAPYTNHTGGYWYDDKGDMNIQVAHSTQPYETFSDDAGDLSVRAAFLKSLHWWVVADRKRNS